MKGHKNRINSETGLLRCQRERKRRDLNTLRFVQILVLHLHGTRVQ